MNRIKSIAIAFDQYQNFRSVYRFFKRRNEREAETLLAQLGNLELSGQLVFDIGANIGAVTEALLELGSRVVAIEPNISLISEIQARCSNDVNLTILPIAISSSATISKFYISEFIGQSSFREDWSDSKKAPQVVFVPTLPFSELVKAFGKPHYVKIDVEGHELDVFLGMKEQIPLVSFEFHMDQPRISEAVKIMERYRTLGGFTANLILEGESSMYFPEWIAYPTFEAEFLKLCEKEKGRSASYGQLLMKAVST
jgi:FkbM family methyltransferase